MRWNKQISAGLWTVPAVHVTGASRNCWFWIERDFRSTFSRCASCLTSSTVSKSEWTQLSCWWLSSTWNISLHCKSQHRRWLISSGWWGWILKVKLKFRFWHSGAHSLVLHFVLSWRMENPSNCSYCEVFIGAFCPKKCLCNFLPSSCPSCLFDYIYLQYKNKAMISRKHQIHQLP